MYAAEVIKESQKSTQPGASSAGEGAHCNAAGIDVGAHTHWVAVPEDRDENAVRSFGVFTSDLIALCEWLKRCQIQTIAMVIDRSLLDSAFQVLERNGFEVRLVNASHAKNVPGRKTDVKDFPQMVATTPHLWDAGRLVSSRSEDVCGAQLSAPARYSEQGLQQLGAANAEGPHIDEHSDPPGHQ